jgi:hypothetical protein
MALVVPVSSLQTFQPVQQPQRLLTTTPITAESESVLNILLQNAERTLQTLSSLSHALKETQTFGPPVLLDNLMRQGSLKLRREEFKVGEKILTSLSQQIARGEESKLDHLLTELDKRGEGPEVFLRPVEESEPPSSVAHAADPRVMAAFSAFEAATAGSTLSSGSTTEVELDINLETLESKSENKSQHEASAFYNLDLDGLTGFDGVFPLESGEDTGDFPFDLAPVMSPLPDGEGGEGLDLGLLSSTSSLTASSKKRKELT